MIKRILYVLVILCIYVPSCKEHFDIKIKSDNQAVLVVDGNLNSGSGSTSIRLSRATAKDDSTKVNAESNASITVVGKDNTIQPINDTGNGFYQSTQLNLQSGSQYMLKVVTKDGRAYQSDYVIAKYNPPIDSISWKRTKEGVTIYANTHDPQNNTWYYRWEYDETYEFHSHYFSGFKYLETTNEVVVRPPSEYIYICWKTNKSTDILLASSAKLQSDVISENPLIFIPEGFEKLGIRYSLLVRQYSLTKGAYDFLQVMKKNTQSISNIFGVLPAELSGNIHCISNPDELVIGYITISPVRERRIFDPYRCHIWKWTKNSRILCFRSRLRGLC